MLRTCFPLPSFHIDDHGPVLLGEVFQDDHTVRFIGIIHIHTASSHAQNLQTAHTLRIRHNWLPWAVPLTSQALRDKVLLTLILKGMTQNWSQFLLREALSISIS